MAGANKPDGKSREQRVSFNRRDADRIARVVRTVEQGDRRGAPLTFGPRLRTAADTAAAQTDIFRTARFTGTWNKFTTATIEFTNYTFTPNTATAKNLFCGIEDGHVGVAKDIEDIWHLISWEMSEVCRTHLTNIQVSLNTETCEITTTLVTATQKFLQLTYPFATCSTSTTP